MIDLWDWRRRIADLYADIRHAPDPQAAWRLWRDTRDRMFAHHAQSPIPADRRAAYRGVPVYAYAPSMRFEAAVVPFAAPDQEFDAGGDGRVTMRPFARTEGLAAALGGELTLFWIGGYGGGVFLPFNDATNGSETFGGGRYLLDTIKSADLGRTPSGATILDFNFAYNPSCAYSDRYVCPLSPPGNRLPRPVRGGERLGPEPA